MTSEIIHDKIIFTPGDVDLSKSPLRKGIHDETYVLGAFNPGLTRLPNGNLLMMVRVAEALKKNIVDNKLQVIRKPAGKCIGSGSRAVYCASAVKTRISTLRFLAWFRGSAGSAGRSQPTPSTENLFGSS